MNLVDFGMIAEILGDKLGVGVCPLHPEPERLERAPQHPAGMRIELCAEAAAQGLDRSNGRLRAEGGAGDEVGVAANVLGERIDRDVGTVGEGTLEHRAQQGIVANQDGLEALGLADLVGDLPQQLDIDERIGRIGGRFDHDDRYASFALRLGRGRPNGKLVDAIDEAHGADAEARHRARQERFGSAIERLGMQDDVAGTGKGEDRRGDRRHAG